MDEDMIDFLVSDAWRDYYYERGLTPRPSPRYYHQENRELKNIRQEVERLSRALEDVLQYLQVAVIKQADAQPTRQNTKQSRKGRKTWPIDTK